MTYTPTEWKHGDTITAEKLNKLEEGLAECCSSGSDNAPLMVKETMTETEVDGNNAKVYTLDKTWQEIHDAFVSGALVIIGGKKIAVLVTDVPPGYTVLAGEKYSAISADDYPKLEIFTVVSPFPPIEPPAEEGK